ncbi:hypothetical protein Tco_0123401 [Tanacetum coccineum]
MRRVTRGHYLNEVVPHHFLRHSGQGDCSTDSNPPQTFSHSSHSCVRNSWLLPLLPPLALACDGGLLPLLLPQGGRWRRLVVSHQPAVAFIIFKAPFYGAAVLDPNALVIGIRALSYRELGCISDMSNSDESRHTDSTTLVPPRLPDTLPQVYHRRRPTLGLLTLPFVSPFPPTIRRTARISVLPDIEPNLTERARISAINLDDYQLDPVTSPPSPSSPFLMVSYQWMIAKKDPTQREEALTAYGMGIGQNSVLVLETALTVCMTRLRGQFYTILEDMDRYPNVCLEELEAFMTLWDVNPELRKVHWRRYLRTN